MLKTGKCPPTHEYTPSEELALCNNEDCPLMEVLERGVSSDPAGSRSHICTGYVLMCQC